MTTPFRSKAVGSVAGAATALALVMSSGATLTASAAAADQRASGLAWSQTSAGGRTHARFVDKHGHVLRTPQLYLIYWGAGWTHQTTLTPTPAEITEAVRTLMASVYLTGLAQYRGSGRGFVRGSAVITSSDPPAGFTDEQVGQFIDAQLAAGTIPGPDADNQTLYGVVVPPGSTSRGSWAGEHNYYKRAGQRIRYAWFTNVGDLHKITRVVSHELVEAATDPDGSGFLGIKGTCGRRSGWCEIADVCKSTSVLDGIPVQSYWSSQAGQCVVPTDAPPCPSKAVTCAKPEPYDRRGRQSSGSAGFCADRTRRPCHPRRRPVLREPLGPMYLEQARREPRPEPPRHC